MLHNMTRKAYVQCLSLPAVAAAVAFAGCIAGYGNTAALGAAATCAKCAFNTFQDRDITTNACATCATTKFTYVNGAIDETITSNGITLRQGSRSSQSCVAKTSQLPVDVGQSIAIPSTATLAWTTAVTGKTMRMSGIVQS
jgi:hypothetical protein